MEKMVEPPPSEGGEATITAMSALAAVGQYLSTNTAKSTFLHNTGLVVIPLLFCLLIVSIIFPKETACCCAFSTMSYVKDDSFIWLPSNVLASYLAFCCLYIYFQFSLWV